MTRSSDDRDGKRGGTRPGIPVIVHFRPPSAEYKRGRQEIRICRERFAIPEISRDLYRTSVADFETIGSIAELESVAEGSAWQNFERLAAYIFEENGFDVRVGTVKTRGRQRRQYDVIAHRNGRTLLAECKQWSGNRYRLSALRREAGKHRERARFYEEVMNASAVPIIVTLIEEEIRVFNGIPLVPVHRLNAFISELDRYADEWSFAEFEEADTLPEEDSYEDPGNA